MIAGQFSPGQPVQFLTDGAQAPPSSPVVLTYKSYFTDTANATTYSGGSWNGLAIGTASTDRYVIFAIYGQSNGDLLSSATFAGSSVSLVQQNGQVTIGIVHVPTGTTGNLSITFAGIQNRASVGWWTVTGLLSATPHDNDGVTAGSAATRTTNIDVKAGGIVIVASFAPNTTSISVSGDTHTQRFDVLNESTTRSHGGDFAPTADALARAFTTTNTQVMSVVSWR